MRRRKDEGLALILALMVLAILIILIAQMSITSLQNRTVAKNHLGDLQNSYASRSGYHLATLYLLADLEKEPEADSLHEKWALPQTLPYGASTLRVETKDSERFLNLSRLVDDEGAVDPAMVARLRKLVLILEHPPDVADRIIDYIDVDTRGEYESRARNERLYNLDELLRIEGLEPAVLYGSRKPGEERKGILQFLTIWPRVLPQGGSENAGKVNVNTAPAEVLESLSEEMTREAAESILAYRAQLGGDGKPRTIKGLDELQGLTGMTAEAYQSISEQLTMRSETFEIHVNSKAGNVERSRIYIVTRQAEGENPGVQLLGTLRKNDFLSVRPPDPEEGM